MCYASGGVTEAYALPGISISPGPASLSTLDLIGLALRVDALVLLLDKIIQRLYKFIEYLGVSFILNTNAERVHSFAFFRGHG